MLKSPTVSNAAVQDVLEKYRAVGGLQAVRKSLTDKGCPRFQNCLQPLSSVVNLWQRRPPQNSQSFGLKTKNISWGGFLGNCLATS